MGHAPSADELLNVLAGNRRCPHLKRLAPSSVPLADDVCWDVLPPLHVLKGVNALLDVTAAVKGDGLAELSRGIPLILSLILGKLLEMFDELRWKSRRSADQRFGDASRGPVEVQSNRCMRSKRHLPINFNFANTRQY